MIVTNLGNNKTNIKEEISEEKKEGKQAPERNLPTYGKILSLSGLILDQGSKSLNRWRFSSSIIRILFMFWIALLA